MIMRTLARATASGLLAVGVLAFTATPALAADVDFGVNLTGTTIAADASGKLGTVSLINNGTTRPAAVDVRFDVSELDESKVRLELGGCDAENGMLVCAVPPELIPGSGETIELPIPLAKQDGATGAAGQLTITVVVEGDTDKANDSATVDVTVGGNGVDLTVIAPDVTGLNQDGTPTGEGVKPGDVSLVFGIVFNQGDAVANGINISVTLPKQTTFAEKEEGCEYTADNRTVSCDYNDISLIPVESDDSENLEQSGAAFFFPVQVSEDAEGPVALKGGTFTAAALEQESMQANRTLAKRAAPALPSNARKLTAAEAATEVDATDNTDPFAVLVAGPDGGTGGGGGSGGGEGPGLPVTGPVAASVAGAGAAILGLGVALFVVSRRRRVVLVTPGDEQR